MTGNQEGEKGIFKNLVVLRVREGKEWRRKENIKSFLDQNAGCWNRENTND